MTTFEIIATVAIIAIVLLLLAIVIQFGVFLQRDGLFSVLVKMSSIEEKLENINGEVGQTNARIDGFIPAFKKLLEHNESIENFWASDSSLVINLLKEIENNMNEHGIAQAKWFDSISKKLTTIANHTNETTNRVVELTDFEKRNEKRNDEMFARCEEINKLQLEKLKAEMYADDFEPFPPKDVVGATSTGICQECRGKNVCKYFDVNRNRCFVADRKEK